MAEDHRLEFSDVYHGYAAKVRSWVARLAGPADADDLTQEVFVKVARSLGTVTDPSRLSSWIYTITRNTVRDAARRRGVRPQLAPADAAGESCGPEDETGLARFPDLHARSPEEAAMRREMVACYMGFVEQLPPIYREVYVLSEHEHLSNEHIASRLGISLATVKIRLHRARARLHEMLRCKCQPYVSERGELMGEPKSDSQPPVSRT